MRSARAIIFDSLSRSVRVRVAVARVRRVNTLLISSRIGPASFASALIFRRPNSSDFFQRKRRLLRRPNRETWKFSTYEITKKPRKNYSITVNHDLTNVQKEGATLHVGWTSSRIIVFDPKMTINVLFNKYCCIGKTNLSEVDLTVGNIFIYHDQLIKKINLSNFHEILILRVFLLDSKFHKTNLTKSNFIK